MATTKSSDRLATATYNDAYAGPVAVTLKASKTTRGISWRWEDDHGRKVDGLRPGCYSPTYQIAHAQRHAQFSNIEAAQ